MHIFCYKVAIFVATLMPSAHLHCVDDGFYPNPNDCGKFYRCSYGQRYSFDCAPGTHWNPSLMVCDWPMAAGCRLSDAGDRYADDPLEKDETFVPIRSANFEPNRIEYARHGRQSFSTHVPSRSTKWNGTPAQASPLPTFTLATPSPPTSMFEPNTLYYDPQTGIYHQFHYTAPKRPRIIRVGSEFGPDRYQTSASRPSVVVIEPDNRMTVTTDADRSGKERLVYPKLVYPPSPSRNQNYHRKSAKIRGPTPPPLKSQVVYADEVVEYTSTGSTTTTTTTTTPMTAIVTKTSRQQEPSNNNNVQGRNVFGENFERVGPDVILVDGRQVYNVNDTVQEEEAETEVPAPAPISSLEYQTPLKTDHLGPRARAKSRREKELNENGFEEEGVASFPPLSNLTLIQDKIRDFLESFNPNSLWMDDGGTTMAATTTTTTTTEPSPMTAEPKPKLESLVVYENETEDRLADEVARLIGMTRRLRSEVAHQTAAIDADARCNGGQMHGPYCHLSPERTGTNFEWLQLADHRLAPNRSRLATTKPAETLAICQEFCWQVLASCVGFSYDAPLKQCNLTYEIESDQNGWLPSAAATGGFLQPQSQCIVGFIMPRWHRTMGNVAVAANLMPVDAEQHFDEPKVADLQLQPWPSRQLDADTTTDSFFQCLDRCVSRSPETCRYALHHQATGLCLVVRKNSDSNADDRRFKLRRGWWLGWNDDNANGDDEPNRFRTETDASLLRLFEQLLVADDRRFFMGRHLQPKHRLDGVTHRRQCQTECRTIRTCRFVAVYENLLAQSNNSSSKISCLFFGEDLVQVLYKLLANEERQQQLLETRAVAAATDDEKPPTDETVTGSGNLNQMRRRRRRHTAVNPPPPPEPITNISAYVLDQPQPLLKFRILHLETIEDSERIVSPPYKTWYGAPSEERCYQQCSHSWLSRLDGADGDATLCRFLVVRSYNTVGPKRFNCTFYELSPIAFTEQAWYSVRSIPDRVPPERVEDYFTETDHNRDNETTISLLDESMYAEQRQICLLRCLQTLVFNGSQRHCFKVHVGRLKSGQYKCRFYDRRQSNGPEPAPSQLFRLRRLPNDTFQSIPSYDYVQYFDPVPVNEGAPESTLARYRPLHVLENERDPNNCLKLCIVLWSRIKSGHDDPGRPDRCRTVYVQRTTESTLFAPAKYRCTIYDVDLVQQARQSELISRLHSDVDRYPVRIYRAGNGTRPELIMSLSLADLTDERQPPAGDAVSAFYHFSGARRPDDCVETRPRRDHLVTSGGQMIIAKPTLEDDPILPGHILVRYECLYFDHDLNFGPRHHVADPQERDPTWSERQAYQLLESPGTYEYVDPDLESVRFSRQFHQPLFVATQNVTTPSDCLRRCSEFNQRQTRPTRHQHHHRSGSVQCQLVVIEPNRIIQNTTQDLRCWFYNYNVSINRRTDLDRPEVVEYYRLVSVPMRTRFDSDAMKYEPFQRMNETAAVSAAILNDGRKSFRHLTNITDRQQCFDECLDTWESKLLYYFADPKRSAVGFCRTIIVVPVTAQPPQYECSLYEMNATLALRAFMLDPRAGSAVYLTSRADTVYQKEEWPLVAPAVTDATMMLSQPVDLDHCLQECDHKPMKRCQAIVARYQHNRLIRCYFVGRNEYLPDYGARPTPNHQSKIFVRVFSLGAVPDSNNGGEDWRRRHSIISGTTNPYLALIDTIRGQNGP